VNVTFLFLYRKFLPLTCRLTPSISRNTQWNSFLPFVTGPRIFHPNVSTARDSPPRLSPFLHTSLPFPSRCNEIQTIIRFEPFSIFFEIVMQMFAVSIRYPPKITLSFPFFFFRPPTLPTPPEAHSYCVLSHLLECSALSSKVPRPLPVLTFSPSRPPPQLMLFPSCLMGSVPFPRPDKSLPRITLLKCVTGGVRHVSNPPSVFPPLSLLSRHSHFSIARYCRSFSSKSTGRNFSPPSAE